MRYIENIISPRGSELRNISSSAEEYFKHEKRNFVSPSGHVMFQKYQPYFTLKGFAVNGAIYYVAIAI